MRDGTELRHSAATLPRLQPFSRGPVADDVVARTCLRQFESRSSILARIFPAETFSNWNDPEPVSAAADDVSAIVSRRYDVQRLRRERANQVSDRAGIRSVSGQPKLPELLGAARLLQGPMLHQLSQISLRILDKAGLRQVPEISTLSSFPRTFATRRVQKRNRQWTGKNIL